MTKEISILRNVVSCYGNNYDRGLIKRLGEEQIRRLVVVSYSKPYILHSTNPDYRDGTVHISDTEEQGRYQNDRFIRLKEYVQR